MPRGLPLLSFTLLALSSACSYEWDRFSANGDTSPPIDSAVDSSPRDSAVQDSMARDSAVGDSAIDSAVPDAGIVREGLVLHLPFDETSGTMTRDTVSGDDLGTVEGGATFGVGVRGNALRFDGVDDRVVVNLDAPVDVGQRFTIAVFLNAIALDGILVTCEGEQHFMLRLDASIGQIDCIAAHVNESDWPTYSLLTTGGDLRTDEWRHLAFTSDDGSLTLYVDGDEVDTEVIGDPPAESGTAPTCHISGSGYGYLEDENRFEGALDDVRIYDRPLTPAEIGTLATAR